MLTKWTLTLADIHCNFAVNFQLPAPWVAEVASGSPLPLELCPESQSFLLKVSRPSFAFWDCPFLPHSLSFPLLRHGPWMAHDSPAVGATFRQQRQATWRHPSGSLLCSCLWFLPPTAQPVVQGVAGGLWLVTFLVPRHRPLWGWVTRGWPQPPMQLSSPNGAFALILEIHAGFQAACLQTVASQLNHDCWSCSVYVVIQFVSIFTKHCAVIPDSVLQLPSLDIYSIFRKYAYKAVEGI